MNDADYFDALDEIHDLARSDPAPDTEAGQRLIALATAVEAYERERFPFTTPTVEILAAFRRDERGRHEPGGR